MRRATLFLEPLDVLQFRDHRPFDMGYHVNAESVFPKPSVLLGCVRTALLGLSGARFGGDQDFGPDASRVEGLLGTPQKQGALALRGPLLARLDAERRVVEPLLSPPQDLESTDRGLMILRPRAPSAQRISNRDGIAKEMLWTEASHQKQGKPDLLTWRGVERYLRARPGEVLALDDDERARRRMVYDWETRVGIVRDDTTLLAEDRMFYMTRPLRFAPGAGLAVDVALPEDKEAMALIHRLDRMVVPLGGKAHRAKIHYVEGALIPELPAVTGDKPYKLWLLTPLPLDPHLRGWPSEIIAAATDRTEPIGGFDMAKRAPKPLRRALPAGTVLWVEGKAPGEALAALAGDTWKDDSCAGYGVALVGERMNDS